MEQNAGPEQQSTILTGEKGGMVFEMWVEVDGKPLEVYAAAEMDDGGSEAWIASEDGKVCLFRSHCILNVHDIVSADLTCFT
jgi:hypothetical protein